MQAFQDLQNGNPDHESLGHSPFHAESLALIFNPSMGRVSPQYHILFDDILKILSTTWMRDLHRQTGQIL